MDIRKVAVLGAGAVGSYVIWGLSARRDIELGVVADGPRGERLRKDGCAINGKVYRPAVWTPGHQIIAVDNDSRELDKIRKAFDLLKTPCLPILYNEGDNIDEKYSNIRIAFFDINLGGLGNPADPLLCNIIASALKEILDKNNGPYALIFWSLHISKLPIIKKYIEEREKDDIPSPLVIDTINKALINNVDELKAEIQRVLANSTLNAMLYLP